MENIPRLNELLPKLVKTNELAELGELIFTKAEPAKAHYNDHETEGFFIEAEDSEKRRYRAFIGAIALVDTLRKVTPPFRAKITKNGRSWRFE